MPLSQTHRREQLATLQWVLLGALIVAEGGLISARFDAAPLADGMPQWWAGVLGRLGILVPLGMALGTATLLFAGTRLRDELLAASAAHAQRFRWLLLVGHLAAFALFFHLTAVVFDGALDESEAPALWAVGWALAGLATLGLWGATILPGDVASTIARRLGPVLPACMAVGIAAWSAGEITASWWEPLRHSTFWGVHGLLAPVVTDLVFEPNGYLIGTQSFLVEIAQKCAGYEGMGLMAVFLGAYLWLFRQNLRFPHALLLLPIGLCLAWGANVVRIAALVAIGAWGSEAIALGGFHAYSGSILFCALALGLAFTVQRLRFFTPAEPLAPTARLQDPTAAYLAPLLTIVASGMITGMVTRGDVDPYYPIRVVAVVAVLWWFRRAYGDLRWQWSWAATAIGAAVCVFWILLAPLHDAGATPPWPAHLAGGWMVAWLAVRLVGAVLIVPVAEELAFRSYFMRRLIDPDFQRITPGRFTWLSFLGSSVLFGVLHEQVVAGTVAGMCYALAVCRRGRLVDAVLAHAVTNALLAAYVLASGNWRLWG